MKGECDLGPSPGFPAGDLSCGGEKLAASPGRTCFSVGVWELLQFPGGLVMGAQKPRLPLLWCLGRERVQSPVIFCCGLQRVTVVGKGNFGWQERDFSKAQYLVD